MKQKYIETHCTVFSGLCAGRRNYFHMRNINLGSCMPVMWLINAFDDHYLKLNEGDIKVKLTFMDITVSVVSEIWHCVLHVISYVVNL